MKTANAVKHELGFTSTQEAVRVGILTLEPIHVYLSELGYPIDVDSAFANSGAIPKRPYLCIAIDTNVYLVAKDTISRGTTAPTNDAKCESRIIEMRWLGSQNELRARLGGQWIAVQGENLIAHGHKLIEVLDEARSKGVEHPFAICLPESHEEDVVVIV